MVAEGHLPGTNRATESHTRLWGSVQVPGTWLDTVARVSLPRDAQRQVVPIQQLPRKLSSFKRDDSTNHPPKQASCPATVRFIQRARNPIHTWGQGCSVAQQHWVVHTVKTHPPPRQQLVPSVHPRMGLGAEQSVSPPAPC